MGHVVDVIATPIGRYALVASERGLSQVAPAGSHELPKAPNCPAAAARRHLERGRNALAAYFAGTPTDFRALELDAAGTPFQRRVWEALREIPYGTTLSYGELARQMGREGAARAVGSANSSNPLAIVVPCHRVVGASGDLTGYAHGVERKRWLLDHEGVAQSWPAGRSVGNYATSRISRRSPPCALSRSRSSAAASI